LGQAGRRNDGVDDHFGSDDGGLVAFESELRSQPRASVRDWAGRIAFGGNGRAFTGRSADAATAIEDQAFRARMTGYAGAFADQILVTRFVVRVDDVSDSLVAPLESRVAQAFMTFADDAVDAAVSAACNG